MGVSADAYIAFGISFEEEEEFPWDCYCDHEEWWRHVNGYTPIHAPFTPEGEWAEGFSSGDPRLDEWYAHREEWINKNPMPFSLENTCSCDYPMVFLAVPSTVKYASRGYPKNFKPSSLVVSDEEVLGLLEFCKKYGVEHEENSAQWHLFSLLC